MASGIHKAASRIPRSIEENEILEKELAQARILAALGHEVYLLPERGPRKVKHPDAVVDGLIMEFKTITGNIRKIKENYKEARKKADNVFLKIDSDFTPEQVLRTLFGTVRRGNYSGGLIIAYFTGLKKIYYWNTVDII
ncbi:MAG: hypothetical protein LBT95_10215 [Treponema sp.]|jgi:hypothetical protein|nr:hypothetical protein [Treponema sp.]